MRIGIDLGGTKIEGLAIGDDGRELLRLRVATPQNDYPATIAALVMLVRNMEAQLGATASVGVGIPGSISPATGLVRNANTVALIGHPLDQHLERALGRPVRVANDANCFALSEASDGAASGDDSGPRPRIVFGVIIGTGTGGGIVIDGKVVDGPNGIAGEWGHNPMPWMTGEELPGPDCYCGKKGCVETFLAGPSLARDHARRTGETLKAFEIAERATAGDAAADETLRRYEDRLARGLASIINVLDPDVIVLGGGVSNIERLYRNVPAAWTRYVFSDTVRTQLRKNQHGDSSGVRGAAWLWPMAS